MDLERLIHELAGEYAREQEPLRRLRLEYELGQLNARRQAQRPDAAMTGQEAETSSDRT